MIPKSVEEKYYNNFITQLVANFDVYAKGFEINTEVYDTVPLLTFKELVGSSQTLGLFDQNGGASVQEEDEGKDFEKGLSHGEGEEGNDDGGN